MMKMTSIISSKMSFINRLKAACELVSHSGITNHSTEPYRVQNAVFHLSPGIIQTRWYACLRWILVQTRAFHCASRRSEMSGSGYWSFLEIWLRPRKLMQSQREPSFFQIKRTYYGSTTGVDTSSEVVT